MEFHTSNALLDFLFSSVDEFALLCICRAQLEVYVERIPLECDKKAVKVLRLCEQYGLPDQGRFQLVAFSYIYLAIYLFTVLFKLAIQNNNILLIC